MKARKDGPDAVGSCLTGPALTSPQIAPILKMFANSRVGAIDGQFSCRASGPTLCLYTLYPPLPRQSLWDNHFLGGNNVANIKVTF
jgi:hypothetical protein